MPIGDPTFRPPQSLRAFLDGDFSIGFHHFEPYQETILRAFDHQLETYSRRFEATEKDGVTILTLVLPGFKQSEVDVELEKGILTVRAGKGDKQVEQSINVGYDIDGDKVGATLENGILTITLVKLESAKPRKVVVK